METDCEVALKTAASFSNHHVPRKRQTRIGRVVGEIRIAGDIAAIVKEDAHVTAARVLRARTRAAVRYRHNTERNLTRRRTIEQRTKRCERVGRQVVESRDSGRNRARAVPLQKAEKCRGAGAPIRHVERAR